MYDDDELEDAYWNGYLHGLAIGAVLGVGVSLFLIWWPW